MAGSLSLYGRRALLRMAFRQETGLLASTLQLALTKNVADVSMSASGLQEPAGVANYGRESVLLGTARWTLVGDDIVYTPEVLFPFPSGDWGLIRGWALLSGANLVGSGPMQMSRRIQAGLRARVPGSTIRFGLFD